MSFFAGGGSGDCVWPVMTPLPIVTLSLLFVQGCRELPEDASCVVTRSKTKMMNGENVNLYESGIRKKSVVPGFSFA